MNAISEREGDSPIFTAVPADGAGGSSLAPRKSGQSPMRAKGTVPFSRRFRPTARVDRLLRRENRDSPRQKEAAA